MKIRRILSVGIAASALVLAGCSTGEDSGGSEGGGEETEASGGGGSASAEDIRIDVITHGAPGDSFWDVVKAGADRAGEDLGVDVHYQTRPRPGRAEHADRQRGRRRHRRARRLDGQPRRSRDRHHAPPSTPASR